VRPPSSGLGPIDAGTRAALIAASPLAGKYDRAIDRDSAHEMLARRAEAAAREAEAAERASARAAEEERAFRAARRYSAPARGAPARRTDGVADAFAKSFARQLGTRSGQALVRGVLGGLFKAR
jgi:Tfp pilus assembly protein PilX